MNEESALSIPEIEQEGTSNSASKKPRRSERIRNGKSPRQVDEDKENVVNCSTPKKLKLKQKRINQRAVELECRPNKVSHPSWSAPAHSDTFSQDPFTTLQEDTADEVLQWLQPELALSTALVSALWRRLSTHRSLWACLRRKCPPGQLTGVHWRVFYTPTNNVDAGHGDEARCYRVRDRATGEIVLAKCVPVSQENGVSRWLLREAAILWNMDHPCIVKLTGAAVDKEGATLFFQDCGSTNLHRLACNGDNTPNAISQGEAVKTMKVSLDQLRNHMFRIISAVAECHAHQIIHRNVKPSKFLVDENGVCWMTSFTSSLVNGGCITARQLMPRMGTTQYLAPEVLLGASELELDYTTYTEKVDMWSAGLILAEMAAGGPLFVVDSEIDLLFSIFRLLGTPNEESWPGVTELPCSIANFPSWSPKSAIKNIFGVLGDDGCDLLGRMLTYNSKRRISAIDALCHPFFSKNGKIFQPIATDIVPAAMKQHLTPSQCVVWATLRKREAEIPVLSDFLANQDSPDCVTRSMREILIDWLNEISYSWFMRAERRALLSAVACLDRYLAVGNVSKNDLQLVGATCYALAAKLEEAEVISAAGYVTISDGAFTEEDMRGCEVKVAHALQCRIGLPTCADFEPLIAEALARASGKEVWADSTVVLLAQMLSDTMMIGYHVGEHQWQPSIISCTAFTVASMTLSDKIPSAALHRSDVSRIIDCMTDMYANYEKIQSSTLKHTISNPRYQQVRETTLPDIEKCITELRNAML